ncbi:hypothetical protein REPUB_Repub16aG0068400 [Reevesia pubescens]
MKCCKIDPYLEGPTWISRFKPKKAWLLFQGGKSLDLVDPCLEKYNGDEVAMCIQLCLLCCQQTVAERPDMNSVHLMLSSDSFTLPRPGKPAIQGRVGRWTTTSTSAFTSDSFKSEESYKTRAQEKWRKPERQHRQQ